MEPETVAELGVTGVPLTTTENAPVAAVVADNASLNVSVTSVPAALVDADEYVGAVVSTVEKFQEVLAVNPPYVLLKLSLNAPASTET